VTDRKVIRWEDAGDGVVNLVLDDPAHTANTANSLFVDNLAEVVRRIESERDSITGVVISSAKSTFFAGADLNEIQSLNAESTGALLEQAKRFKELLRRLERSVPMVAAINGAALGGGTEIALCCHRRIVVDNPKIQFGLPEVQLGLLPGGGGVVRTVRLLGVASALSNVLLSGAKLNPSQAQELGLVDELVDSAEDLIPAAKRWIAENPEAQQPWDRVGYRMPGGTPSDPKLQTILIALPAGLRKQLNGARYPAPIRIMSAAVEGAQVDFDSALEIETRYFAELLDNQIAKNMVQAFFFDMRRVTGARGRPADIEPTRFAKVVVLGAGMMGAGIGYSCAMAGMEVVLKDVSMEAATIGKAYSEGIVARAVKRGRMSEEAAAALLARITPTDDPADAQGCELVIEAVFEDPQLKGDVFNEVEPYLAEGALLCSNTSTLPITDLAARSARPADYIGTHFMSPVDKMPLVEVITASQTSDRTLYRTLDLIKQIRKTPIVVNDSRGFFTSRVIQTYVLEALAMLAEGVPPASIEQASVQAGYPVKVLQLLDEGNLNSIRRVQRQNAAGAEADGKAYTPHPGETVITRMIDEFGRPGRIAKAGFYEYDEAGQRQRLWTGLADAFPPVADPSSILLDDIMDRLLYIESIEAVRCLDEGVLNTIADANVGSLMAIGYPGWTGGVLQHINGYPGGPAGFVARARELAAKYGDRFTPPASLVNMAECGEIYSDDNAAAVS